MNTGTKSEAGVVKASPAAFQSGLRDDRVLPEVRWIAAVVIVVLVTAVGVLYLLPDRTGQLFAWKINPQMSAIFLGAGYAGGAYFFTRVSLASRWHTVATIYPPTTVFVWLMLAATLLHLDKFLKDTLAFNLWIIIYLITPILVPALWLRNRGADPRVLEPGDISVPLSVRRASAVVGVLGLVIVVALFVLPQFGTTALGFWPWQLTPLTSRVVSAALSLPAVTWIILAREQRWSAWRVPVEMQSVALVLILLGMFRAWDNFNASRLATWLFLATLLALIATNALLYFRMESRRRAM